MPRRVHRIAAIATVIAVIVLVIGAGAWKSRVERWIDQTLRSLAAATLRPALDYDALSYRFPRSIVLSGVRLTSPDPRTPGESIDILVVDELTLVLADIPRPNRPFRMKNLDFDRPIFRLFRIPSGPEAGRLLGFANLLKGTKEREEGIGRRAIKPSDLFEVRSVSIVQGAARFDPWQDGTADILIDGIGADLLLQPQIRGAYDVDFVLSQQPVLSAVLRGQLFADDFRLSVSSSHVAVTLAREHDQLLTPRLLEFVTKHDLTGLIDVTASGMLDLANPPASRMLARVELEDGRYVDGGYVVRIDRAGLELSLTGRTLTILDSSVEALGGRATIDGTLELRDGMPGALELEAQGMQIADLLLSQGDVDKSARFSGLLDLSANLQGPVGGPERGARGYGSLHIRQGRLALLPILSTIDEALDRAAEAAMKRERKGHDALDLDFRLDGDLLEVERLRMNSRWYGLRGDGDVYRDSRLDLIVNGGPLQRVANELGSAGEVVGEITETLVRAHVTGTLEVPKVEIEILRTPIP